MNWQPELCNSLDEMVDGIRTKADMAERIACGDITGEVILASEQDGLGKSLNAMISNLNDLLNKIHLSSDSVALGTSQLADSSQSLSQGATEQAASLEEISSSMTEIGSQTRANSDSASEANRLAVQAQSSAQTGNSQMDTMITAMNDINDSSKHVEKIIKVIDDIAFQTNLLALNAAVEAARAGKHGKGFAVVAEEVRSLAARSAKAARESADLIEGSTSKVNSGVDIANSTAKSLAEVVDQISKASNLVGGIASSSDEQNKAVLQITDALGQIDKVTQQTAAGSEETASAASNLSGLSHELQSLVMRFELKDNGRVVGVVDDKTLLPEVESVPNEKSLPATGWGDENF